jgi:hypothetical protein
MIDGALKEKAKIRRLQNVVFPGMVGMPHDVGLFFLKQVFGTDFELDTLPAELSFFEPYRRCKVVYKVHPMLADHLKNTTWPEKLPCSAIKLPYEATVIELEGEVYCLHYDVNPETFFVPGTNYGNPNDKACVRADVDYSNPPLDLYVKRVNEENKVVPAGIIDLQAPTLQDSLERFYDSWTKTPKMRDLLAAEFGDNNVEQEMRNYIKETNLVMQRILTVLLYITGNADIVSIVHPGQKPRAERLKAKPGTRRYEIERDLSEPDEYLVGHNYVSVLERWEEEQSKAEQGGTHASPRPHIRQAHAHLYWAGEGRKIARVHFLPPIPVKGGVLGQQVKTVVVK